MSHVELWVELCRQSRRLDGAFGTTGNRVFQVAVEVSVDDNGMRRIMEQSMILYIFSKTWALEKFSEP
jgi:hypothetical protein